MHQEVLNFLQRVKEKYPEKFKNVRVLELGSLNINGTPKYNFLIKKSDEWRQIFLDYFTFRGKEGRPKISPGYSNFE